MLIISIFEQSIELEQALAELEHHSVLRENICVVFMENEPRHPIANPFQSSNAFEVGISVSTGTAVIGASMGFTLPLGPILCGLIATFIGFAIGFFLTKFIHRRKKQLMFANPNNKVTVIFECNEKQKESLKKILWGYKALYVGQTNDF